MNKKRITLLLAVLALAALALSMSGPLFANSLPPDRDVGAPDLATTVAILPVADSYVNQSLPTTNYGTSTQFRVDGSPLVRSFLRFNVAGLSGSVTQATLRIYANSAQSTGYSAYRVASNTWSETTINYSNAPALGTLIGASGPVAAGTWTSVNVTTYITGNGTFSLALATSNATALSLASRESANKPQLVITTSSTASPTATKVPPTATKVPPTATPGGPTPTKVPPTATKVPPTATPLGPTPTQAPPTPTLPPSGDPYLLAGGDTRSGCTTGAFQTVAILDTFPTNIPILHVGDMVDTGTLSEFTSCYDQTWGRHKAQHKPVPGNHEYGTAGASGYFTYFGALAGPAGLGYYSFDYGTWHVVALNSEIDHSATSTQVQWLKSDLTANKSACTLAFWHKPRFSSGMHGSYAEYDPFWQALYSANAEIVLNGDDHDYERFAPQNPSGQLDTARGIREYVIAMGGVPERAWGTLVANSEVRNNDTWGVMKFTLHPDSYDWKFLPVAGKTFTDSGTTACH